MAVFPYIVNALNTYLFTDQNFWYDTFWAGAYACEVPFQSDNVNAAFMRYVQPIGRWDSHRPGELDNGGSQARGTGGWSSYQNAITHTRPNEGYYVRNHTTVNETARYGFVASFCGGYIWDNMTLDALNTVDYEPCYGHKNAMPHPNTIATQFRDSEPNNQPVDGSSTITLGGTFAKSKYQHPSYLIANIVNGGTVGSGNVSFFLEERPTYQMSRATTAPIWPASYELATATGDDNLCSRAFLVALARWMFWPMSTSDIATVWDTGYPDGTYAGVNMAPGDGRILVRHPLSRYFTESRIREGSQFSINDEYYGFVSESHLAICSLKTGIWPLVFVDLATIWPTSPIKRIGGVAVDLSAGEGSPKVYLASDSGHLAVYDFTVNNGALSTKANLTLPAGEAVASLAFTGGKLHAYVGTQANAPTAATATAKVGVAAYDPVANTWGAVNYSALPGRVTGRALNEMIALRDGRLAMVPESLQTLAALPDVFNVTSGWASSVQTWGGGGQSQTLMVHLGYACDWGNYQLPKFKCTLRRVASGSYTVASAKIGRVAKMSNGVWRLRDHDSLAVAGIPFDEVMPITFGGQASTTVGTTAEVTSDFVNMALDYVNNDYYLLFDIDGTFGLPYSDVRDTGQVHTTFRTETIDAITGTLDTTGWSTRAHFLQRVFNDDASACYTNAAFVAPMNSSKWQVQVMLFDPSNGTWNTSKVDSGLSPVAGMSGAWGMHLMHTNMIEAQPNVLLLQTGWWVDRVFAIDVSKSMAAFSDADITPIGQGTAGSIFPTPYLATWGMAMRKTYNQDRVVFLSPDWLMADNGGRVQLYLANPDFDYKTGATTKLAHCYADDGDRDGGVVNFRKDMLMAGDCCGDAGYTYHNYTTVVTHLSGNVVGSYRPASGYWANARNITGGRHHHHFLPTYYKWTGSAWRVAQSWADAAASPRVVPTTPNTALPILWGLTLSFGPASGTTFTTGEWHTINASYGFVKFARKARYTYAIFAGKTFNLTEQRNLSDYTAVQFKTFNTFQFQRISEVTGPQDVTYTSYGDAKWPRTKSGAINAGPVTYTYEGTKLRVQGTVINGTTVGAGGQVDPSMPVWSSLLTHPMTSNTLTFDDATTQVASASGEGSGDYAAWRAFSGRSVWEDVRWQNSGNWGQPWVQVKLRAAARVRAYTFVDPFQIIYAWKLQGSANGSTWVDLHTVTQPAPLIGNTYTIPDPGVDYLYYRLQLIDTRGYTTVKGFHLFSEPLVDTWDITDIYTGWANTTMGNSFEVSYDGTTFTPVTPLWSSSHRSYLSFNRMTNVKKFRISCKVPANDTADGAVFHVGDHHFYDYGIPTTHATRLGASAAADNTPARGSYDTECLGVAGDIATLWVDNNSPAAFTGPANPNLGGADGAVTGWFHASPFSGSTYKIHPFFGFIRFGRPTATVGPDGGCLGSPAYVPTGTVLNINYHWGRRV